MRFFPSGWCVSALITLFLSIAASANEELPLMPWPLQLTQHEGQFHFDKKLTVQVQGEDSARLQLALNRFANRIERQTGNPVTLTKVRRNADLIVHVRSDAAEQKFTTPFLDESYQLTVDQRGIRIEAENSLGALHGLETLLQLVTTRDARTVIPAVAITDAPRFVWRGTLVDVSRHFLEFDTLKRQIDVLAAAKFNIFHWHLTDDQGWRFESKKFPKLQEKASEGQYYTQEQIRELVEYASDRGIHVMPEIDMPGHASALAIAYPELMSAPGPYEQEIRWGVHRPLLNPADEKVYEFIDTLFSEVVTLFPFEYIHVGGDEAEPHQWRESAEINAFMKEKGIADYHALHVYFNQRVSAIVQKHQRKMVGWDEIQDPNLPKDVIIQSWQGQDALGEAVNNGFQGILSTGFYVDQPHPASFHYRNELIPQPLTVDQNIHAGESWSSWRFEMPRKRGSPLGATLTVIEATDGALRGYIDFDNRARRDIHKVKRVDETLRFHLDTWMGAVSSRLVLKDKVLSGSLLVTNVHYFASGKQIAGSDMAGTTPPVAVLPADVSEADQHRILGGEMTLWAEIVNNDLIDLRLWPRGFAIAERLWSAKSITDEDSMYHRLQAMADWSVTSLGVLHEQQQLNGIRDWLGITDTQPVLMLSQAVEQAQYYHRHHEKSTYGTYSRKDPLNRFVDTLPAESISIYQLSRAIDRWLVNTGDTVTRDVIIHTLNSWANNYPEVARVAKQSNQPLLEELAQQVQMVSRLGLHLMQRIADNKPLTEGEHQQAKAIIADAQTMRQEVVVSVAFPVEQLLDVAY